MTISFRFNDTCKKNCPENEPCTLSKFVNHELCICDNPRCRCHSEARYFGARKVREGTVGELSIILEET